MPFQKESEENRTLLTSSTIPSLSILRSPNSQPVMPSRKKSSRQLRKAKHLPPTTAQLNHRSSPAVQSQVGLGEGDLQILRDQNGRNGNYPLRPNSGKCQYLVVDEKKKGFPVSAALNEMEETQKVESRIEDKQVLDADEETVKSVVESTDEVVDETQQGEEDSTIVIQNEESSLLVDSEKIEKTEEASEIIVDEIKQLEAELKVKDNQEKDSQETELSSSALEAETSREVVVESTEADEDKLDSSEEKKEVTSIETNEELKNSECSVPQADVVSRAIEETTIVIPEESEGTKLVSEEEKIEESTVVIESSKEEATESLPPSTAAAETTSSTVVQDKTEIPPTTESQQTAVSPHEYSSWRSCCGIFDFLSR